MTCVEVFELQLGLPDVVAMQSQQPNPKGTGETPLRHLVKEALRMRPDRLVVGEVRQECLDLLIVLNSGLPNNWPCTPGSGILGEPGARRRAHIVFCRDDDSHGGAARPEAPALDVSACWRRRSSAAETAIGR